ncbi:MAG: CRISPR-associated endonuclease Cas3'', partial [Chamaesiphon sp.]|nr:CRISPR-associated endonuclease Cas3'' [Chamaesiphon sp.]
MNKIPEMLLAKSRRKDRDPISLEKHLLDTDKAAYHIFRLDKRLGQNWCRFFKISTPAQQKIFLLNLQVAALFHDIGKANEDFMAAVQSPGFPAQTLRHEHLSALILCLPEVRDWLGHNPDLDLDIITGAVLSHHLKASRDEKTTNNGKSYKWGQPQTLKASLAVYLKHSEVKNILDKIAKIANLESPIPKLDFENWSADDPVWKKAIRNGRDWSEDLADDIEDDEERRLLLAAVKAGLIAADGVASGLVREDLKITDWIDAVVHGDAIADSEIANKIIYPRLGQIKAKQEQKPFELEKFFAEHSQAQLEQLRAKMLHEFQVKLGFQSYRTLLLAGCGVGKTLAAWVWAEA